VAKNILLHNQMSFSTLSKTDNHEQVKKVVESITKSCTDETPLKDFESVFNLSHGEYEAVFEEYLVGEDLYWY